MKWTERTRMEKRLRAGMDNVILWYKRLARRHKIKYRVWKKHDTLLCRRAVDDEKTYVFFQKFARTKCLDSAYPLCLRKKTISKGVTSVPNERN